MIISQVSKILHFLNIVKLFFSDEDFLSGPPMQIQVNCLTKRMEGLKSSHKKKIFVPLCTPDGSYAPLQCDPATHNCWCSDKKGNEIQNTRTRRTPNCCKCLISIVDQ